MLDNMNKVLHILILFLSFNSLVFSQDKFVVQNLKKSEKIHFKLINNLIIVPVEINDVKLSIRYRRK